MPLVGPAVADKNVAWVHVSMKIAVSENLGEEDLHAFTRELFKVDVCFFKPLHPVDRNAVHPLHHNYVRLAVIPEHFRDL